MAQKTRQRRPKRALLDALREESAALAKQITVLMNEMAARGEDLSVIADEKTQIDALIARREGTSSKTPKPQNAPVSIPPRSKLREVPTRGPLFGMALPEASAKQLEIAGKPLLTREIWPVLERAGFKPTSQSPVHALHWALRRREKKIGDVLSVGEGKWGLKKWYTPAQLEKIARSVGGMAGRDRQTHIEKTKIGIANLRARGGRWGPPIKFTAKAMEKFYASRKAGKTVKESVDAAGFASATYYLYHRQYDIESWKPGDPWPPPKKQGK